MATSAIYRNKHSTKFKTHVENCRRKWITQNDLNNSPNPSTLVLNFNDIKYMLFWFMSIMIIDYDAKLSLKFSTQNWLEMLIFMIFFWSKKYIFIVKG